jgi:N-acyl-L-homoserine lactone synthetase
MTPKMQAEILALYPAPQTLEKLWSLISCAVKQGRSEITVNLSVSFYNKVVSNNINVLKIKQNIRDENRFIVSYLAIITW